MVAKKRFRTGEKQEAPRKKKLQVSLDRADVVIDGMTDRFLWAPPGGVLDVWQAKDLRKCDFGSVAMIGLTGEISEVWDEEVQG